jgi:hypothetical protein
MGMQAALQLLYPPQCISCAAPVQSDFGLCADCWRETPFISGLVCDQCGVPCRGGPGERVLCDDCMTIARPGTGARGADVSRQRAAAGAGAEARRPDGPCAPRLGLDAAGGAADPVAGDAGGAGAAALDAAVSAALQPGGAAVAGGRQGGQGWSIARCADPARTTGSRRARPATRRFANLVGRFRVPKARERRRCGTATSCWWMT